MKNIHTFIFCSSLFLVAWLTASYTVQIEKSGTIAQDPSTPQEPAAEVVTKTNAEEFSSTISLSRLR